MLGSAALTPTQLGGRADWNRIAYQVVSSLSLRVFKGRLGDHLPEVICGVPVATQPLYLPISAILTGGGCHSGPGGQWSRWVALNRGPGQSGWICGGAALPSPPWPPFLRWPLDTARPLLHSGKRVLQCQLRAREQPQALPLLAVHALRGGRAGPQQVCGQQPGEVLRLQRCLQVLRRAWRVGLGPALMLGPSRQQPPWPLAWQVPGRERGGRRLCQAHDCLRQYEWYTRGAGARAGPDAGGGAVPQRDPGTGCCQDWGQRTMGKAES